MGFCVGLRWFNTHDTKDILVRESKPCDHQQQVLRVRMLKRVITMEERDGRRALACSDLVFWDSSSSKGASYLPYTEGREKYK